MRLLCSADGINNLHVQWPRGEEERKAPRFLACFRQPFEVEKFTYKGRCMSSTPRGRSRPAHLAACPIVYRARENAYCMDEERKTTHPSNVYRSAEDVRESRLAIPTAHVPDASEELHRELAIASWAVSCITDLKSEVCLTSTVG